MAQGTGSPWGLPAQLQHCKVTTAGPSCTHARSGTSWQHGRGRQGSMQGTVVASALGCLGTSCGVMQEGAASHDPRVCCHPRVSCGG